MFSLVYSPWERVTTSQHGCQVITFLSIFAVPNNTVFWITSNLTFTPIRFMYSLKLTDTAPRAPITAGTKMTFRMHHTFAVSSPGMATSITTTSLSLLSINTMSGLLASIFQSHWTVKSHSILKFHFPPLPPASVHTSFYLFPIQIYHKVDRGYTVPRLYSVCASLPHSLTTWATVSPLLPHILHKEDSAV